MIIGKGSITVAPGLEYITQWCDITGQYLIDQYVSSGRIIINKKVTGCGFTTYCLKNQYHTILVSPRLRLIQDKVEQVNSNSQECFYFNREKDSKGQQLKSIYDLCNEFAGYYQLRKFNCKPLKILVTYDSFCNLADMLEGDFKIDISKIFQIAIDESHCLIKDVKLKENANKCVLSQLITRLFNYDNLLFISATPICQYIQEIPEFNNNKVDYYELEWSNVKPIIQKPYRCKNATDAFDQIFRHYSKDGYFDAVFGASNSTYSTEAVIFINSVQDIRRILRKYIVRSGLINVSDVAIICADNKENQSELHKVHRGLKINKSIPKLGEQHKTWTFVTRTAFEGVDFYSPCASTFVIANYNVDSLSIDIASDIPQIVGRQRRKDNPFRDTIHIYYVNNWKVVDDMQFSESQNKKMQESNNQISIFNAAPPEAKDTALNNIKTVIEKDSNRLYVTTVRGFPEINQLIIVSEQYCRDILKNQLSWFVIMSCDSGAIYSMEVQQLKEELEAVTSIDSTLNMMRIVADFVTQNSSRVEEMFEMLRNEGYNHIGYYFSNLSIDRILANGFNTTKMDQEIAYKSQGTDITTYVRGYFEKGKIYSKKEVKARLQNIYNNLGLHRTAKATDLKNYIECEECKKDGIKAIRVK